MLYVAPLDQFETTAKSSRFHDFIWKHNYVLVLGNSAKTFVEFAKRMADELQRPGYLVAEEEDPQYSKRLPCGIPSPT
jgi:hypothetical protein